jgi:hypothetical protein
VKIVFTPVSIVLGLIAGLIGQKIFRLTDHGAPRTFAKATGAWPGEEAPERE